jgi:hypothetical protein
MTERSFGWPHQQVTLIGHQNRSYQEKLKFCTQLIQCLNKTGFESRRANERLLVSTLQVERALRRTPEGAGTAVPPVIRCEDVTVFVKRS